MDITIPKGYHDSPGPCWLSISDANGKELKPLIKCQCGKVCGIQLHHVHSDGKVTASFYHSANASFQHGGKTYQHKPGCGWHVFLTLADWTGTEFLPEA